MRIEKHFFLTGIYSKDRETSERYDAQYYKTEENFGGKGRLYGISAHTSGQSGTAPWN